MPEHEFGDRPVPVFFVPKGLYIVGVEKAKETLAKESGNEQIKMELRIFQKGANGKFVPGPMVFDYLTFTEKVLWKIDTFLKSTQLAPKKGEKLKMNNEWIESKLVGALGWVELGEDEYQDKKKNVVAAWLQVGPKTPNPYPLINVPAPAEASI